MVGILYGDDGDTYQSLDGGQTWDKVGHNPDTGDGDPTHSAVYMPYPDDDYQHMIDEHGHDPGWEEEDDDTDWADYHAESHGAWDVGENEHYHDPDDDLYTPHKTGAAAAESEEEDEEDDDDLRLHRQDHLHGTGDRTQHMEIHEQEHAGAKTSARYVHYEDGDEIELLSDPQDDDERGKHLESRHGLPGYKDEQTHGNDHYRSTEPGDPDHIHQSQLDEWAEDYGETWTIREGDA